MLASSISGKYNYKTRVFFYIARDFRVKEANIRLKINRVLYKINWFNISQSFSKTLISSIE